MNWISTKGMTNDNAPEGKVLVQHLTQFFGHWSVDFVTGYYDNPNDYVGGDGEGWKNWETENKIIVIAYCELSDNDKLKHSWEKLTQKETIEIYGEIRPNLGSVGE